MATEDEARAAGFSMPQGTWSISGGDDAIRINARKALDLFNEAKFVAPFAGTGGDLNDLTEPGKIYGYWSDWANKPTPASGSVLVIPPVAGTGSAISQIAFPYGNASGIYYRYRGSSGAYSGWTRMDAGAVDGTGPSTAAGGASASALKSVPLILTAATASGEDTATAGAVRFPLNYGARITRWRVHVRNYNHAAGKSFTSGGRTSAVWFGPGTGPAYSKAPSMVAAPIDIPTDGSDAVSQWVSTPLEANTDYLLSIGWITADATPKVRTAGGGWVAPRSADANSQSGSEYSSTLWMPFDWWIEAETEATTPTVAGYGDSITTGTGTPQIAHTSWLSQFARKIGALPVHWSYPGSGMSLWTNANDQKWNRWQDLPPADAVIHFMGQNDLGSAASAEVMRERFETTLPMVKSRISPNVYAATITPHASKTDEQNAIRRAHNDYLRSRPAGVRDVFEFATAVSSDDRALKPEYRGGNGTDELHPNAAGGLAMANTITRPVITEPAEDISDLHYDSGKRLIPLENGWSCYQAVLRRQGRAVSLYVRNMTGAAATSDTFLTMPVGFRDNAVNAASQPVSGLYPYKTGGTELTLFSVYSGALNTPSRGTDLQLLRTWTTSDPIPATLPGTPA